MAENTTLNALSRISGVLGDGPLGATYAVLASPPEDGTVTLQADGGFIYTPTNPDFTGYDTFSFYTFDGFTKNPTVETAVIAVGQAPGDTNVCGMTKQVQTPPLSWQCTYNYLDPWVEKAQGESVGMIVATVTAKITTSQNKPGMYHLEVDISSAVPAQKVTNPLVQGGALPAGVNLRTESFLRLIEPGNRKGIEATPLTLDIPLTPQPTGKVSADVNPKKWPLPAPAELRS